MKKINHNASQSKKGKYSDRLLNTEFLGSHGSFRTHDSFYRKLVESLDGYGVFTTDNAGTISSWNSGAESLLGYTEQEIIGKNASVILPPKDRRRLLLTKLLKKAAKEHRVINERYHLRKDGSLFWATGLIFLLEDTNHDLRGFTFILQDQTEQKKLDKRKDDFISTATHELKTPITSIKLFAEVVARQTALTGDGVSQRSIEELNKQLDRLTALMDYLLDVSKIQHGKLELKKTSFNLNKVIEELLATIQIVSPRHNLLQKGSVSLIIVADKERVIQVLTNLLTNATKYSPKGGEVLVTTTHDSRNATVSVKDSGLGIAKSEQEAIFDRFYRASGARSHNISGIGLGLHIVQKIIRAHHGKTWVESTEGQGSTFSFSLPIQKKVATPIKTKKKATAR